MSEKEFEDILGGLDAWYIANGHRFFINKGQLNDNAITLGSLCDFPNFNDPKFSKYMKMLISNIAKFFKHVSEMEIILFLISAMKKCVDIEENIQYFLDENLFQSIENKTKKNLAQANVQDILYIFEKIFPKTSTGQHDWYSLEYVVSILPYINDEQFASFVQNFIPIIFVEKQSKLKFIHNNALICKMFEAGKRNSKFVKAFAPSIPIIIDLNSQDSPPTLEMSKSVVKYFIQTKEISDPQLFLTYFSVAVENEEFMRYFASKVENIFALVEEKELEVEKYLPIILKITHKYPRELPPNISPKVVDIGIEVDTKELNSNQ